MSRMQGCTGATPASLGELNTPALHGQSMAVTDIVASMERSTIREPIYPGFHFISSGLHSLFLSQIVFDSLDKFARPICNNYGSKSAENQNRDS